MSATSFVSPEKTGQRASSPTPGAAAAAATPVNTAASQHTAQPVVGAPRATVTPSKGGIGLVAAVEKMHNVTDKEARLKELSYQNDIFLGAGRSKEEVSGS